ncbi:MAG TPA: branched-chain amino acid aminotransferase [Candidatus Methanofastidiosa archaeon]|nr:branched-chain amino acid aminotransferase [Candidatus Methanofastidiosa archaeon]
MNIKIQKTEKSRLEETDFDDLGFGHIFTDHMFMMDYKDGRWQDPRIVPFQDLEFSPALITLHYAQTIFEGMKAYHSKDGKINIFRPDVHAKRINSSARRLCIPEIDEKDFMQALTALLDIDREWVPKKEEESLYIRPFIFGTDEYLGVAVSKTYRFMIIMSPVSRYYKEGLSPISLMTSGEFTRACEGGTGNIKSGGNYASSLYPAELAKEKGYAQILWLDNKEHKYVEEVGTMNILFLFEDELVTAPLEGTILAGVTRDSILTIAKAWGYNVSERKLSIDEVLSRAEDGSLKEVFGAGTAAIVSPVGRISHLGKVVTINNNETGEFSKRIYDELNSIRYGEIEDTHGWNLSI